MRVPAPLLAVAMLVVACAAPAATTTPLSERCTRTALDTLYPGVLTVGTDQPVYPPWYMGDNPSSGEGFESALAYAVADRLGYPREDVRWVRVPFNAALNPGPKSFDINLSEFSITEQRRGAVDFSTPYFDVTQAVVAVKTSQAAGVRDLAGLRSLSCSGRARRCREGPRPDLGSTRGQAQDAGPGAMSAQACRAFAQTCGSMPGGAPGPAGGVGTPLSARQDA